MYVETCFQSKITNEYLFFRLTLYQFASTLPSPNCMCGCVHNKSHGEHKTNLPLPRFSPTTCFVGITATRRHGSGTLKIQSIVRFTPATQMHAHFNRSRQASAQRVTAGWRAGLAKLLPALRWDRNQRDFRVLHILSCNCYFTKQMTHTTLTYMPSTWSHGKQFTGSGSRSVVSNSFKERR